MHQQVVGGPAKARIDCRVRDTASRPRCSIAGNRSLPRTGRHTLTPQHIQVSCPAVEQDTELPSSSGRQHADNDIIHALFQTEQPALVDSLVDVQKDSYARELNSRVKAAGSLPLLCDLIQQEATNFDYRTGSHALYRLSILCNAYFTQLQSAHLTSREAQQAAWVEYVEPALQTLGQLLIRHMDTCDAWAVANSFWAYGNLQCSDERVAAALCERGLHIMHEFTALDCASSLVGIAKLKVRPRCLREFVDHLLSHTHELLAQVDSWGSQEVANVVWALSRIGAAGPSRRALLQGLLEMTLWRLQEFKMRELALIVYSCGRMRLRMPLQLVKITNHIAAHLKELNPLDAAHVLWGCAKLDFKPGPELLERLPHVMVDRLSEFKPQEVCNLLYGYGHLRHQHPFLLEGVVKACSPRLHEFSTQDLCLTIWSYGMVGYCPSDSMLFDNACRVLLSRSNRLLPLELTMAVKGFARCGYQPPPEFMRQIAQLAVVKLHQFNPAEYAQLLWAYATLGYRDVPLFEAVVAHTIHALQTWTRRLPKTTVDTIVYSCEKVGFWPQSLIDTAEMQGLYVKTRVTANSAEMEQLLPPGSIAATGAAAAGAPGVVAADVAGQPSSNGSGSSTSSDSSRSNSHALAGDDFGAAIISAVLAGDADQQQQEQQEQQVLNNSSSGAGNSSRSSVRHDQQGQQQQLSVQPDIQAALEPHTQHHQHQQHQQPPPVKVKQHPVQMRQQHQGVMGQLQQQHHQQPGHQQWHSRHRPGQQQKAAKLPQLLQPPRRMPQQQQQQVLFTAPSPTAAVTSPLRLGHSSGSGFAIGSQAPVSGLAHMQQQQRQ